MSRPHALAAVTQVLLDLVDANLRDNDVSSLVNGSGPTTALPPDRVLDSSGDLEQPRLNLFLHGITYNPAYRNADLPARDTRGELVNNPVLGLDMHYLLTAYAPNDLQAETLMGFGMEALHRNPMPSRQRIVQALTPPEWQSGRGLNLETLEITELAQQIESIKITPETLSVDDMSKLWTALQTHLRLTCLYAVSVVLIESKVPKRTPLPVLTRGPKVLHRVAKTFEDSPDDNLPQGQRRREEGVLVQPGLVPAVPTLEKVIYNDNTNENNTNQIAARIEESIKLEGHHLDGDEVMVRFTETRSRRTLVVRVSPSSVSPTHLEIRIPPESPPEPGVPEDQDPTNEANWQAGFYSVAALVRRPVEPPERLSDETPLPPDNQATIDERSSNELPVVLAPTIDDEVEVSTVENSEGETVFRFAVKCRPPVRNTQKAALIVGQREIPAEKLEAEQSATLIFRDTELEGGTTQPLRLIVDGVSSIFIDRNQKPPVFTGPFVDIP